VKLCPLQIVPLFTAIVGEVLTLTVATPELVLTQPAVLVPITL
jgi:hypothetical protein